MSSTCFLLFVWLTTKHFSIFRFILRCKIFIISIFLDIRWRKHCKCHKSSGLEFCCTMLYITTCQYCMTFWKVRDSDKSRVSSTKLRSASYPYPGSNMWTSWPSLSKGQLPASWIRSKEMYSKFKAAHRIILLSNPRTAEPRLCLHEVLELTSKQLKQLSNKLSVRFETQSYLKTRVARSRIASADINRKSSSSIRSESDQPGQDITFCNPWSNPNLNDATFLVRLIWQTWYANLVLQFNDTKERLVGRFKRLEASPIEDFQDFYCKSQVYKKCA